MKAWRLLAGSTMIAALVLMATSAAAQTPASAANPDYQTFCASCHGAEGHGDGIMAKSMRKRPADLTQLTVRNNGVFPADSVAKTVEGKSGPHGNQDMPAWGEVFAKSSDSPGDEQASLRIDALVRYLQTLQAK